jgi:predicted HicB family RNase H-like nuclease
MKKNFTDNPAFEMISQGGKAPAKTSTATAEAPKKVDKVKAFEPLKKETKSKKVLLLIKPSLLERIQAKAEQYSISTNELINQVLDKAI